jgi:hypothetical protein
MGGVVAGEESGGEEWETSFIKWLIPFQKKMAYSLLTVKFVINSGIIFRLQVFLFVPNIKRRRRRRRKEKKCFLIYFTLN